MGWYGFHPHSVDGHLSPFPTPVWGPWYHKESSSYLERWGSSLKFPAQRTNWERKSSSQGLPWVSRRKEHRSFHECHTRFPYLSDLVGNPKAFSLPHPSLSSPWWFPTHNYDPTDYPVSWPLPLTFSSKQLEHTLPSPLWAGLIQSVECLYRIKTLSKKEFFLSLSWEIGLLQPSDSELNYQLSWFVDPWICTGTDIISSPGLRLAHWTSWTSQLCNHMIQ